MKKTNRLKKWAFGAIGSSVLLALGITSCGKKTFNNNEIIDVYGPPPSEFVDSLDQPDVEEPEVIDSTTIKTQK